MPRFKNIKFSTVFSITLEHTFYYRFICEKCGHKTEWFENQIKSEGIAETQDFEIIDIKKQGNLEQNTKRKLEAQLNMIKRQVTRSDYEVAIDKCPICKKKQSWSTRSMGLQNFVWIFVFVGVWLGFLYTWKKIYNDPFESFIFIVGSLSISLCGMAIGNMEKKARKRRYINALNEHTLEFDWGNIELAQISGLEEDSLFADDEVTELIQYKELKVISLNQTSKISLIQAPGTKQLFIKRELKIGDLDIYNFIKEKKALNIVDILHVEKNDDVIIVIEEFLEGVTLKKFIETHEINMGTAYDILCQLCEAFIFLHQAEPPIVYNSRNMKDIIVCEGHLLKLVGFESAVYDNNQQKDIGFISEIIKKMPPKALNKLTAIVRQCEQGEFAFMKDVYDSIQDVFASKKLRKFVLAVLSLFWILRRLSRFF